MASTYTRLQKLHRVQKSQSPGKSHQPLRDACVKSILEKNKKWDLKQAADPKGRKEANIYLQLSLINVFTLWTIVANGAQLRIFSFSRSFLFYVTNGQGDISSNTPKTWQQNPGASQLNLESTFQECKAVSSGCSGYSILQQFPPLTDATLLRCCLRVPS